jgi:hypothetical protein
MNRININTNVVLDVNPTYEQGVILYVMSKTPLIGLESAVDLEPYTPIRVNSLREFTNGRDGESALAESVKEPYSTQIKYLLEQGHNVILYVVDHENFTNETKTKHTYMTKQSNLGYDIVLMAPEVPSTSIEDLLTEEDDLEEDLPEDLEEDLPEETEENIEDDLEDLDEYSEFLDELDIELEGDNLAAFSRLKEDIKNIIKENHVELIVQDSDIRSATEVLDKLGIENYLSYKVSVTAPHELSVTSYSADLKDVHMSTILAGRRARYLRMNKPYLPVAGEVHGLVHEALEPKNGNELLQSLADVELLQSNGYITMRYKRGLGYLFSTQNTGFKSTDKRHPFIRANNVTQHLWLVRQINNYLESVLYAPNNQKTWDLVRLNISKIFDRLLGDGISAYRVLVGLGVTMNTADIEEGKLLVRLAYRPINVIETIEVNILVNSATGEITISDEEAPAL